MNPIQAYFVWNRHGNYLGTVLARSSNTALETAQDKFNDHSVMVQAVWHYLCQHGLNANHIRRIDDSVKYANIIEYLPPSKINSDPFPWHDPHHGLPPVRNKTMFRAHSNNHQKRT